MMIVTRILFSNRKRYFFTEIEFTSILKVIRQAITRRSNQDFTFIPRTCAFVAIASIQNGRRHSVLTHIFINGTS